MQYNTNIFRFLLVMLFVSIINMHTKAQTTKALNQLIPMEIVDKRGSIHKLVSGMEFNVHTDITVPVKYLDGCSEDSFGSLIIELNWYDASDETGKFMLQSMKDLNVIEQDKQSFFAQSDFDVDKAKSEDFAGGALLYTTSSKACVNEITGPTGITEYFTDAKCFVFTGTTIMKIEITSKIKPETVKTILSKIVEEAKKFDFSVYKTTVTDEEE